MADDTETETGLDAYALLSKPTLELSDAEVDAVIADLRKRREAYIKTGKADRPAKEKKAIVKATSDEKTRNTAMLLAQLKLSVDKS